MDELIELMRRLRDPQTGCPWDLQQDWRSLLPHTLEEVYELVDAIERDDIPQVRDEIGDYLFQAVFYAQIASEKGWFDFTDVSQAIVAKLLKRHPHVFPDGTLASRRDPGVQPENGQIKETWENIKQRDREGRALHGILDDVPVALPALQRAEKLQKRAARSGFDWPDWRGPLAKLHEEIAEVEQAVASGERSACEDELGDLLFSCVNLARHLQLCPETALRRGNAKFESRFRAMERALAARGMCVDQCDAGMLDAAWNASKL